MYYPVLRARQFELIMLRELAREGMLKDYILPILEPVKESYNNLNLALREFELSNQHAYLILNPEFGQKNGDTLYYLDYIHALEVSLFIPAFHYRNNRDYIIENIEKFNLNDVMLLCGNDISMEDEDFKHLTELSQ